MEKTPTLMSVEQLQRSLSLVDAITSALQRDGTGDMVPAHHALMTLAGLTAAMTGLDESAALAGMRTAFQKRRGHDQGSRV